MGSEWREVVFSEAIKINPKRKLERGKEYPYIDMKSVEPYTRKISNISTKEYKGSGSRFIKGDTLFARITPSLENGKTAYVRELNKNEVGFGSTEFIVLSNKEEVTDNKYVYYLSRHTEIRDYAIKSMTGTSGRQRVDRTCFDIIKIRIPPIHEQQKIASILSAFDDKIELNNEMNKTLEEIAQVVFKHWFVDFEFPNENGEPYKSSGGEFEDSELGPIPKGWKVSKIKDTCPNDSVITGKTPSTKIEDNYGDYMMFITIPDIHGNMFIIDTRKKLSLKGVNSQKNKILPPLSICVSCIATPGLVCLTSKPSQTNQQINSIVCKDGISPYYIYFLMKDYKAHIINLGSAGTATLNLNKSDFEKIDISYV